MRLIQSTILAVLLCSASGFALAQTYTPKQILIKGAGSIDTQQLIGVTALKPGPMTKQEIEAAL